MSIVVMVYVGGPDANRVCVEWRHGLTGILFVMKWHVERGYILSLPIVLPE